MPRLLVLTQTHNLWGGIETWMGEVLPGLESLGWELHFGLARGARYNEPERFLARHDYVRHWRPLDGRAGTPTARQRAILAEIDRAGADVAMPLALGDALPALRQHRQRGGRTRVLVPVHSAHVGALADVLQHRDLVDAVGAVSALLERWLQLSLPEPGPRIYRIPNGVPASHRDRVPGPPQDLRVGFVGRLEEPIKRVQDLAAIVRSTPRSVSLVVAGDGPASGVLAAALADGVQNGRVRLLGFVPRAKLYEQVYPELDCLLLTSETEGSPLAVIEAMRHGVVPIVSRFDGIAAEGLLRDGDTCLTFPVGDTGAAAAALAALARSPDLRERLSRAAFTAAAAYDSSAMIAGWAEALAEAAASTRALEEGYSPTEHPAYGRLERWHIPALLVEWIRRARGLWFEHASGFDEWPGSVNADRELEQRIASELGAIEEACRRAASGGTA